MVRERTPDSILNPGEFDPMGRENEYITLMSALRDQFAAAQAHNREHPGFEYLLYDNDPNSDQRIATFRLMSPSYDGDITENRPNIDITVPIDPEDDDFTTILLDPDARNENFTITNRLFRHPTFRVTYDNFDKLLDRPVSKRHSKGTQDDRETYRQLLLIGEPIPLKYPKPPMSDLIPGHI